MIKQHRDHQRQGFMPGIKMPLHGSHAITQQTKRHMCICRALMLNHHVDVAVTYRRLQ